MKDDNERILELIQERLAIGEERYGHGVRKNDDTTQWGTKTDSWTEMGLEEALDLTIYLSAQLLRVLDKEAEREKSRGRGDEAKTRGGENETRGKREKTN